MDKFSQGEDLKKKDEKAKTNINCDSSYLVLAHRQEEGKTA